MERNNEIAAVIFDCDGVLVDSEPIANRLFHRCLVDLGLELSAEETNDRFMGRSMQDCIEDVERLLARRVDAAVWSGLAERTQLAFDAELQPVRDIEHVLQGLDLPRCVASSGSHGKIRHSLRITGLTRYFEHICSADDVSAGKPAPDLFLLAAKTLSVPPAACVVIEDSLPGVRGAVAAGMRAFGYCERSADAALAAAGATTFRDMRRLPALLKGYVLG